MKKALLLILLTMSMGLTAADSKQEPTEMFWEDLMPKGYDAGPGNDRSFYDENPDIKAQQNLDAPIVPELNGKRIKLPGFVVPLEGDDEKLTEFLLVPYFGACIHVPPPPPNQIVHVTFPEGAPVDQLYDAIWLTGTITTKRWEGDAASVGYSMTATKVEAYY